MNRFLLFSLLLIGSASLNAQNIEFWKIPVIEGTDTLALSGVGGFNTPQFSEVDFDNDGVLDLLAFDRSGQIAIPLKNKGIPGQINYEFATDFLSQFPQNRRNYMMARDYDLDGIEDLFLFNQPPATSGGIGVMKGSYVNGKIQFNFVKDLLSHPAPPYASNINPVIVDVPGVIDVDYDGDMDILTFIFDFSCGTNIHWYRNMSVENGFNSDSLNYVLEMQCFGLFSETNQDNNTFNLSNRIDSCANSPFCHPYPRSPRHAGSGVFPVDWNVDGNMDLVISDVSINSVNLLTTVEVNDTLLAVNQDPIYPSYDVPVDLFSFPGVYFVDVDNDGNKDMLASPIEKAIAEAYRDSMIWYYKNTSNDTIDLEFQQADLFVNQMIDLGQYSSPEIVDVNSDGLLDIVIGNFGIIDSVAFDSFFIPQHIYTTSLTYLQNVGVDTSPVFKLMSKDLGNFSNLDLRKLDPTFGDLDNDGDLDMIMGNSDGTIVYVENIASPNDPIIFGTPVLNYRGIDVGANSTPQLVDIDRDGDLDLMIGDYNGRINFFENTGSVTVPAFNSTATSNTFGFDLQSYGSGSSAPFYYDNNGAFELYLGHQNGEIIKLNNIDANFLGVYDTVSLNYGNMFPGWNSTIAVADLNNDDTLDYVLGNIRGGLTFYSGNVKDNPMVVNTTIAEEYNALRLYPNPASHQLQLEWEAPLRGDAQLSIIDALGRVLQTQPLAATQQRYQLDIQKLPAGLYYLQVSMNDGTQSIHKFQKR